jgi:hypothetical protein
LNLQAFTNLSNFEPHNLLINEFDVYDINGDVIDYVSTDIVFIPARTDPLPVYNQDSKATSSFPAITPANYNDDVITITLAQEASRFEISMYNRKLEAGTVDYNIYKNNVLIPYSTEYVAFNDNNMTHVIRFHIPPSIVTVVSDNSHF